MITRRDFLRAGAAAGTLMVGRSGLLKAGAAAGAVAGLGAGLESAEAATNPSLPPPSPAVTQYTEQLFVPPTTEATGGVVTLSMENNTWSFHAQLGSTPTFGFMVNGIRAPYLGPTIVAQRGSPITVNATNNLGTHPMAPWISTVNGITGMLATDASAPRVSLHHHGGYNAMSEDGGPMDSFPSSVSNPAAATRSYSYANDQQAATLWYHDHAVGITRLNVYAGLAGGYWLRDEWDTGLADNPLGLPYNVAGGATYEIPLVLQDKAFVKSGGNSTLNYTPGAPNWVPEFFGDVAVVNGKAWPNLNVEPAIYRFRIINGSEARFYNLSLSNGGVIYQIGTDSGLLDAPVPLTALLIAPGERADVLLDFRNNQGVKIILQNNAAAPYPSGKSATHAGGAPLPQLMQFTVGTTLSTGAVTTLPTTLRSATDNTKPAPLLPLSTHAAQAAKVRNVLLFEILGLNGLPALDTINLMRFSEAASSVNSIRGAAANTLEEWDIVNMTGDVHPIHVHLVNFQLLNRQNFNTTQYQKALNALPLRTISATNQLLTVPNTLTGLLPSTALFLNGPVFPPAPNEAGWKDTIQCPPGQVTRILVPYGYVPAFDVTTTAGTVSGVPFGQATLSDNGKGFTGTYVYHCHILDHEENDMMQDYSVV